MFCHPVADPVHGEDIAGMVRSGLQLLAQVLDVRVDGPLVAFEGIPLDLIDQLQTREGTARMSGQREQQFELRGS